VHRRIHFRRRQMLMWHQWRLLTKRKKNQPTIIMGFYVKQLSLQRDDYQNNDVWQFLKTDLSNIIPQTRQISIHQNDDSECARSAQFSRSLRMHVFKRQFDLQNAALSIMMFTHCAQIYILQKLQIYSLFIAINFCHFSHSVFLGASTQKFA
jgi:hypothetical protein